MRYRWDPAYPMGRRRHAARRRLDCGRRTTSATRWPTSSRATTPRGASTRSSSRAASTPRCRPPRGATSTGSSTTCPRCRASRRPRRRGTAAASCPGSSWCLLALAAGATIPFYPMYHVPWLLFAVVGFVLWRPARRASHAHHRTTTGGRPELGHGPLSRAPMGVPTARHRDRTTALAGRHCAPWPSSPGCPTHELDDLAACCDVSTAHPGQVVQAQDVPVRLWHVIVGGHAVVQRDGTPIGLLGRGDSWSEHSLLNQHASPIAVVALSPLTLLTLSRRQFFEIPERTLSWPDAWWPARRRRPTARPCRCSTRLAHLADTRLRLEASGLPVRIGTLSRGAVGGASIVPEEISLMRTLAGWCVRHRRIVVLLWLLVLVASIFTVQQVGTDYSNNFNFPHTQSFDAINLLKSVAPAQSGDTEQVVFGTSGGTQPHRPRRRPAHQQDGRRDQRAAQRDGRDQPLRRVGEPRQHGQRQQGPHGRVLPGHLRQADQHHPRQRGQDLRRDGDQHLGRRAHGRRHGPAGRAGQQPVVQQHGTRRPAGADRPACWSSGRSSPPSCRSSRPSSPSAPPSVSSASSVTASACPPSPPS